MPPLYLPHISLISPTYPPYISRVSPQFDFNLSMIYARKNHEYFNQWYA